MERFRFLAGFMVFFQLITVFIVGASVGSFFNVCIYRLPLEKSLLWPGSRCGHCFQPIRWYDNIPLLSYWLLARPLPGMWTSRFPSGIF